MGFCSCTVKLLLFIFNLICALVGLAILSFAVYFYLQTHSIKDFAAGSVSITAIIMMVLGGVTFLVAFLGCCGAANEDPCCISTYATLLSVILVGQLILAGFFVYFAQGGQVEKTLRSELEKDYNNYNKNGKTIDLLQTTFRCCGYDGPSTFPSPVLPLSCCPKESDNDRNTATVIAQTFGVQCSLANSFKEGCALKITNIIKGTGKNGSIVLFVIAAVELICIVAAFCIANSIRKERVPYSY
uniref:Tetraspanin n=1 Tax=Lygus hesperus TaxID=30085 RepID=A0A0A9ZHC9_LYGHE